MKYSKISKYLLIFLSVYIFLSCGKDEIITDKSVGEWMLYSSTDKNGVKTIWDEFLANSIALIPQYSCMEYTATITDQMASIKVVLLDETSSGCLNASISVFTWAIDPETGFYNYTQGTSVTSYLFTYSNADNRMTWKDQTSGATTVWDRVVEATAAEVAE